MTICADPGRLAPQLSQRMSLFLVRMSMSQCPALLSLRTRLIPRRRQSSAYVCTRCPFAFSRNLRFPFLRSRKDAGADLLVLACKMPRSDFPIAVSESAKPSSNRSSLSPASFRLIRNNTLPCSSLTINSWCRPRKRRRSRQQRRLLSTPQVSSPATKASKSLFADRN
jgi:hypothetical protein